MSKTSSTKSSGSTTSSMTPTFSGQGQSLLNSLAGRLGGAGDTSWRQSTMKGLARMAQAGGESNPFLDDVINRSNAEAEKLQGTGLAKLRAGGYRGGTASNIFNQGTFANDFAASVGRNNAELRLGDYDTRQNRVLQALQLMGGLDQGELSNATSLLSLLRGENKTGTEESQSKTKESDPLGSIAQGAGMAASLFAL